MPLQTIVYFVVFFTLFFLFTGSIYRDNYARTLPFLGVGALLFLFAGLRYYVGIDYPVYMEGYNHTFSRALQHMEPIWQWLRLLLLHFEIAPAGWFMLTSAAIVIISIEAFRKQSYNLAIALLAFVLIYKLYFESFNMVRQSLAMAIVLFAYPALRERKYWKALAILLLAFCFHESAIVLLLLLPLCYVRYPRWFIAVLLLLSYFVFPVIMKPVMGAVQPVLSLVLPLDMSYLSMMGSSGVTFTGVTFAVETLIAFYWLFRKKDLLKQDESLLPYINSFFLAIIITNTFANIFQVGNRFMYYFLMCYPILLSNVFMVGKRLDRHMIIAILFFEALCLIRILFTFDSSYSSFWQYKIIFHDREAPMKYPEMGAISGIVPETLLCPKQMLPKLLPQDIAAPWHATLQCDD